ncbi:MAG: 6-phosphogluconolactonase [Bacteroidetes bacterium]|nr:6-phosphogluconolactonase [Bacteroidota bacterium]MBS1973928.1 6-phosphogluconolactonase [Bacteroidota bacterium]
MHVHIFKTADEFNHAVADWMVDCIAKTLQTKDRFTLVLSGGNTPKALYQLLSTTPYRERINWEKIHFFWGDERYVPFNDNRNNARMAYETLLNHVPVPPSQIHVMQTENISPGKSAEEYEKILHQYFPFAIHHSTRTTFDLVLLGMGDDGHVLSLFPGNSVVHEEKKWATSLWLERQDMYRITLTKTVVNKSKHIAFLTTGINKAPALKEVLEGQYNPNLYPSQEIKPEHGELHWFVDEAAAELVKK